MTEEVKSEKGDRLDFNVFHVDKPSESFRKVSTRPPAYYFLICGLWNSFQEDPNWLKDTAHTFGISEEQCNEIETKLGGKCGDSNEYEKRNNLQVFYNKWADRLNHLSQMNKVPSSSLDKALCALLTHKRWLAVLFLFLLAFRGRNI